MAETTTTAEQPTPEVKKSFAEQSLEVQAFTAAVLQDIGKDYRELATLQKQKLKLEITLLQKQVDQLQPGKSKKPAAKKA